MSIESIELVGRCTVCRCYMDGQDLFCANCGTENPIASDSAQQLQHSSSHYSFDCQSCGASMSYDASARALRCPFCGSSELRQKRSGSRSIKPDSLVLLSVTRKRAESILRKWLGSGFWKPADAARASTIGEMAAVYVPFWVFEASTNTLWTADSSPAPAGSRGDWYPVSGSNHSTYPGILVVGSSILTPHETDSISPFDLMDAVRPEGVNLENTIVEEFRVPRKLARPLARGVIEQFEREACQRHVPNRSRNVNINVRIASMRGTPMLLPVWVLAYRYKRKVHRVLINGQSGKISGSAPFSYRKLTAVFVIIIAILLALSILLLATSQ